MEIWFDWERMANAGMRMKRGSVGSSFQESIGYQWTMVDAL
jgi:hypothetical protein